MKAFLAALVAASFVSAPALARDHGDRFSRLDKDGDGKIALSEIDESRRARLAEADADKDGYLSEDEMRAAHQKRRDAMKAKRFPDANKDGVVDRREFEEAARDRFDQLDVNGDGRLSEDEVAKAHKRGHGRGH